MEFCQKEGIVVQGTCATTSRFVKAVVLLLRALAHGPSSSRAAYCPILRGQRFDDPTLMKLAKKHDVTVAQILIRWSLQKGFVPLPKSDTPGRIQENADLENFELDEGDLGALDKLDEGFAVSWNPVTAP